MRVFSRLRHALHWCLHLLETARAFLGNCGDGLRSAQLLPSVGNPSSQVPGATQGSWWTSVGFGWTVEDIRGLPRGSVAGRGPRAGVEVMFAARRQPAGGRLSDSRGPSRCPRQPFLRKRRLGTGPGRGFLSLIHIRSLGSLVPVRQGSFADPCVMGTAMQGVVLPRPG